MSRTLLRAFLDPLKPLPTHYGAIIGLAAMGPEVVRIVLLPVVENYVALIQPELDAVTATSDLRRQEAMRCHSALAKAVGTSVRAWTRASKTAPATEAFLAEQTQMHGVIDRMTTVFGDALQPHLDSATA